MTVLCHYAIVRFMPFVETEEFANVGVVLFSPESRFFDFRLVTNRHARISHFFEQLDPKIFRVSMRVFRDELARVAKVFMQHGVNGRLKTFDTTLASELWSEVIKPRETMIRFGAPRIAVSQDAGDQLDRFFRYYVERNFVTREYQEHALERDLRGWLRAAHLAGRFDSSDVGDDEYHARFPFVERAQHNGQAIKLIKPLNLGYQEPAKIIDHGGQWVVRVKALKKRNHLPSNVLFAVDGPSDSDMTLRSKARAEVVRELEDTGVEVVPFQDRQSVISFAER